MNQEVVRRGRRALLKKVLSAVVIAGIASSSWAQEALYKNEIQQGHLKVKFTSAMSLSVGSMRLATVDNKLVTGIQSFDAVSESVKAHSMQRLFPWSPDSRLEAKHRKHGLHLWYLVDIDESQDPVEAAEYYSQLAEVDIAEADRIKTLPPVKVYSHSGISTMGTNEVPFNDPQLPDQWHYQNTGTVNGAIEGSDINLFDAWQTTAGSSDVIVSVHDMGVDVEHNDLADNIWVNEAELNGSVGIDDDNNGYIDDINGWNFDNNSGNIEPQYHGTHVAGTISAVNNNGIGVAGVAGGTGNGDGAKIMSLQIIGGGSIEQSYIYAADNGAIISQNSWGYTSPGSIEQSILDGIDYFIAEAGDYSGSPMQGGLVVFAAGNSGSDSDFYPGYYENVVAVSATGPDYLRASYSNYGSWVDITAPGGATSYGTNAGVLSTLPDNSFGYLDGTSMACPHISGVAALILANRNHQYTEAELKNQLLTGVFDIEEYNPDHKGKLGSGQVDAALAIQNDEGLSPDRIQDLSLVNISQEFAILNWTVPNDQDDERPSKFHLYYYTEPITEDNLGLAEYIDIANKDVVGTEISYEIQGLYGLTEYSFAISSSDRWGNHSVLSNEIIASTNAGPSIDVDEASKNISITIDVTKNEVFEDSLTILNNDEGLLRWNFGARHTSVPSILSFDHLVYPELKSSKSATSLIDITMGPETYELAASSEANLKTFSFETQYKDYGSWAGAIVIGETDTTLTNSSAARYFVDEPDGFNLTDLDMIINHDATTGPMIIEIYKGVGLEKQNLIYAQEYSAPEMGAELAKVHLEEQLYFEYGETFWIVFHVPSGNLYPLGMGIEFQLEYSDNCFISFDLGNTWTTLESAIGSSSYAWTTAAISKNEYLGEYITLNPDSGEVPGFESQDAMLTVDGSKLINGSYGANLLLNSNDANNKEFRIPLTLDVIGHQPQIYSAAVIDYGSVFRGTSKSLTMQIENYGLGHWDGLTVTSSNPDFTVLNPPSEINAKDSYVLNIEYVPNGTGISNGTILLESGDVLHSFSVYANSIVPPEIAVSPLQQTVTPIALGDSVNVTITVDNIGQYPLSYYIPGWGDPTVVGETSGVVHQYGYKVLTNEAGSQNVATYVWNDISSTGTNINQFFGGDFEFSGPSTEFHFAVPLEFKMPFYSYVFDTVYITRQGMINFDNSDRLVNYPRVEFNWGPDGFISAFGSDIEIGLGGNIYYYSDQDRFIVQYENVHFEWFAEMPPVTFQLEMLASGDINIYYNNIENFVFTEGWFEGLWESSPIVILEDPDQKDGIQLNGYDSRTKERLILNWKNGLAVTFEYPGPDIIYDVINASGSVLAGESKDIQVFMATESLYEGNIKRNINIISNDPVTGSVVAASNLEITSGGTAQIEVTKSEIDFGQVFQGAQVSEEFVVKNNGTAPLNIDVILTESNYTLKGNIPVTIPAQKLEKYIVDMPTAIVGVLKDTLRITDGDGNNFEIIIAGEVLDPPGIDAELTPLSLIMDYGDKYAFPFSVQSNGIADLDISVTGADWLSVEMEAVPSDISYSWKSTKEDTTGLEYVWRDIVNTGIRVPDTLNFDQDAAWAPLELPFTFEFYGIPYDTIYLGYNGVLTFTNNQPTSMFAGHLPIEDGADNLIAPLWLSGGFYTYTYGDISGLFYQLEEDHVIITYSYVNSVFGMGSMISHQTILYENGTIKFQYRIEEDEYGADLTTMRGTVGAVNKGATDFIEISGLSNIGIGSGLAYALYPTKSYLIDAGTTLSGTMNFDASTVYAGSYKSAVIFETEVPGSEQLIRPVSLTVTGSELLTVSKDTIDFGQISSYEKGGIPASYDQEFYIINEGVDDLNLSTLSLGIPDAQYQLEIYADYFGLRWLDAESISLIEPLKPEESILARITLTPTEAGVIANEILITAQLLSEKIVLKGNVNLPPKISVPLDEILVSANSTRETFLRTLEIGNPNGGSELRYQISVEYTRDTEGSSYSNESVSGASEFVAPGHVMASGNEIGALDSKEEFNRVLSYEMADAPNTFLGYGGSGQLIASTHFNAGDLGFNLTHVQAYFRTESVSNVEIGVEILVGSSISDALSILKSDYNHTGSGDDEDGSWITIELEAPVTLSPNEDFYIALSYPYEIDYPQGTLTDNGESSGDYWLKSQDQWFNLQEDGGGFERAAWLMRAAEENFASNQWVTILSSIEDSALVGGQSVAELEFDAANARQGRNTANLVISSNDPVNPVVKVPLAIQMNEGPQFSGIIEGLNVDEGDTLIMEIEVADPEGHNFMINEPEIISGWSYSHNNGFLSIQFIPNYSSAGINSYVLTATDAYDASNQLKLDVRVNDVNRTPVGYVVEPLNYIKNGDYDKHYYSEFIYDPDGDDLTYQVNSANSAVAEVFSSGDQFVINPKIIGQTTVSIQATDIHGATTTLAVPVEVNNVLGISDEVNGLSIFPNPVIGILSIQSDKDWSGKIKVEVLNLSGMLLVENDLEAGSSERSIDLSALPKGLYMIRITSPTRMANLKFIKD